MLARIGVYVLLGLLPEPAPLSGMCVDSRPLLLGTPAPCTGLLISEQQARDASSCVQVSVPALQADLKRMTDVSTVTQTLLRGQVEYRDKLIDQLLQNKQPVPIADDVMWASVAMLALGLAAGITVTVLYK